MMEKLGFNARWINLIIQCITSVTYSIIINGVAYRNIIPIRGLRRGDPLSLSLFRFYAEGLSTLMHEATRNQAVTGISISRGCLRVTHLFFADDSILFYKASLQECQLSKQFSKDMKKHRGRKSTSISHRYFSALTHLRKQGRRFLASWVPCMIQDVPNI